MKICATHIIPAVVVILWLSLTFPVTGQEAGARVSPVLYGAIKRIVVEIAELLEGSDHNSTNAKKISKISMFAQTGELTYEEFFTNGRIEASRSYERDEQGNVRRFVLLTPKGVREEEQISVYRFGDLVEREYYYRDVLRMIKYYNYLPNKISVRTKIVNWDDHVGYKVAVEYMSQMNSYDGSGELVSSLEYSANGTLWKKTVFEGGREVREVFDIDQNLVSRTIVETNQNGDVSAEKLYDHQGSLVEKKSYLYKHDTFGNWIEREERVWSSESDSEDLDLVRVLYRTIEYHEASESE